MLKVVGNSGLQAIEYGLGGGSRVRATPSHPGNTTAGQSIDGDHDDITGCLGAQSRCWNDRGAVTIPSKRSQQSHPVDLGLGDKGDAILGGTPIKNSPECRSSRWEEQRSTMEITDGDALFVGQLMIERCHQEKLFIEKRDDRHVGFINRQMHDGSVQQTAGDVRDESRGTSLAHDGVHAGMPGCH
jgi:hypothetical protein